MSSLPKRLSYGSFTIGAGKDGVVHLQSELPDVVAIGMEPLVDFIRGNPPMGGPHVEMNVQTRILHFDTPECSFTYECLRPEQDSEGWFFLFKRVYVSSAYPQWLETRA